MLVSRCGHQGKSYLDDRGGRERESGNPGNGRVSRRRVDEDDNNRDELEYQMKKELIQFLKENLDIFAWSHENMLRIVAEVI